MYKIKLQLFLVYALWYFGLHLCTATDDVVTLNALCPNNCTCDLRNENSYLSINCNKRLQPDPTLTREIDNLVMNFSHLRELVIHESCLTSVPLSVCNKTSLRFLNLDDNKLEVLLTDCFVHMKELQTFSAVNNNLTYLQDRLFDGLENLEHISLDKNQIEWIGLRVFSNSSDLLSLRNVSLNNNQLTTMETWPFIRSQVLSGPIMEVSLVNNLINAFTNELNWTYDCRDKSGLSLKLLLRNNKLRHFNDIFIDMNMTFSAFTCLHNLNRLRIDVAGNDIFCDCVDYNFLAIQRKGTQCSYLDDTYCTEPVELRQSRLVNVPMEQLFCEIKSKCPAKCKCRYQPSNLTYHILCPSISLNDLPVELPPLNLFRTMFIPDAKPKYKLDFSGNNITSVQTREYFKNTVYLDLNNNKITNISDDALLSILDISKVYLDGNELTNFSAVVQTLNFTFSSLSLYNNPWDCGCDAVWTKTWLSSIYDRLENPDAIQCNYPIIMKGKVFFAINDTDFCTEWSPFKTSSFDKNILVIIAVIIMLTIPVIVVILKARVKMYTSFGVHPFDRDECVGEEMDFDVFIAFSHADRFEALSILNYLESEPNFYKVCFHERDFYPGELILDNITNAIFKSRRVLCLLSTEFLKSNYCIEEFEIALNRNIQLKRQRLIVLMFNHSDVCSEITAEQMNTSNEFDLVHLSNDIKLNQTSSSNDSKLIGHVLRVKDFINRHTYIEYQSNDWKQKLLYAMPLNSLSGYHKKYYSKKEVKTSNL